MVNWSKGPLAEHARRILVDVGQERVESPSNLLGVWPLEANLGSAGA